MNPDIICKLTEDLILEYDKNGVVLNISGAVDHFFEQGIEVVGEKFAGLFEFYDYQSGEKLTDLASYDLPLVFIHSSKGIISSKIKLKELDSKHYLVLHKLDSMEKSIIEKCEFENKKDLLDILGKLSHDFNNLLGVVMGHAELANYLSHNEKARKEHIIKVLESSVKIKNLIKQVLVYRHHMDEKPLEKVDLKSVIDRSIINVRAESEGIISIKVKQPGPIFISASVSKLLDVFSNIIQNAAMAIDQAGEIYIDIIPSEEAFHKIVIKDNGVGMSQRTMDHIYEPFFSTNSRMKSAGVGLSIVKGILDQIGGVIDIRSELNQGTEVTVQIPVYEDNTDKGKALSLENEHMVPGVPG